MTKKDDDDGWEWEWVEEAEDGQDYVYEQAAEAEAEEEEESRPVPQYSSKEQLRKSVINVRQRIRLADEDNTIFSIPSAPAPQAKKIKL